jgi:hypothetical protein
VGACPRHQHRNKHQYSHNAKHTLGPSLGPSAPGSIVYDISRRRTSHVVFITGVPLGKSVSGNVGPRSACANEA